MHQPRTILIASSIAFFLVAGACALILDAHAYPSPDETASRVFMERVSRGLPMAIPDALNAQFGNVLHPRSTTIHDGALVPQGFPVVMALYGVLTRFTGVPVALWTPLLVASTLPMLFLLFREIIDRTHALTATLLAYVHPQVLYYSIRGLYTNLIQVCLVIAMLTVLVRRGRFSLFFSGTLLGLAIAVRPSELVWVLFIVIAALIAMRSSITVKDLLIFFTGVLVVGIPTLLLHLHLYGNSLFGYRIAHEASHVLGQFSARTALRRLAEYSGLLLWWWTPFALAGIGEALRSVRQRPLPRLVCFIGVSVIVSAVLVLMYGSWQLRDTISEDPYTIGTSFARYWIILPILSLPFVALGFSRLRLGKVFIGCFAIVSLLYPLVFSSESIAHAISEGTQSRAVVARAQTQIPAHAVVLVERSDKIFWPTWRVVVGDSEQEKVLALLPSLAARVPLYLDRDRDLAYATYWNADHLQRVGLELGEAITVSDTHTLLRITPR